MRPRSIFTLFKARAERYVLSTISSRFIHSRLVVEEILPSRLEHCLPVGFHVPEEELVAVLLRRLEDHAARVHERGKGRDEGRGHLRTSQGA